MDKRFGQSSNCDLFIRDGSIGMDINCSVRFAAEHVVALLPGIDFAKYVLNKLH